MIDHSPFIILTVILALSTISVHAQEGYLLQFPLPPYRDVNELLGESGDLSSSLGTAGALFSAKAPEPPPIPPPLSVGLSTSSDNAELFSFKELFPDEVQGQISGENSDELAALLKSRGTSEQRESFKEVLKKMQDSNPILQ